METIENIDIHEEINAIIIAIIGAVLFTSILVLLFFYFSRKKILEHKLAKKDLEIYHQKEMLHAILNTQEEERKRIAQDLYDDISSKLNVVSLNSHLLKRPNLTETENTEIVENIISLTKNALENSRRIAHDLLPPVLEKFGLHSGIEELVSEYNSTKVTKVVYTSTLDFKDSDFTENLHIFRIIQELLNNAVRHGNANEIKINFFKDQDLNFLIFEDNGIGFKTDNKGNKGIGLRNIESRVDFLNGKLQIESELNQGTKIVIQYGRKS